MNCRFCARDIKEPVLSLGKMPLANAFLTRIPEREEPAFPLDLYVCPECYLVQVNQAAAPEDIFSDYAYVSSFADGWLAHVRDFAVEMIAQLQLHEQSRVVEIASNDGHLLKPFLDAGAQVLGVEPARNVAKIARQQGIPTRSEFFSAQFATQLHQEGIQADLLVANNVLAHVPDLHDFVEGLGILLSPEGVLTIEFPHLVSMLQQCQFDTIYHEHFSYFSFSTARAFLLAHQLKVFDVQKLSTHGGSLRLYASHAESKYEIRPSVAAMEEEEMRAGVFQRETYKQFAEHARTLRDSIREFLAAQQGMGKRVAAYGAPAKGNTLLNFCGIGADKIAFTVDRSRLKQGKFLPGSRIPVYPPAKVREMKPEYLMILPWNWEREIRQQMDFIAEWGGKFVIPVPEIRILEAVAEKREVMHEIS